MSDCAVEILLVESDATLSDMIGRSLESAIWSHVTLAESAAAALREDLTGQHDLIILSAELPDDEDFSLFRHLRVTNAAPVIVIASDSHPEKMLEAMRQGITNWFEKPFDLAEFSASVAIVAERALEVRRQRARFNRLRRIARRVIREREDLNERMDLLCRDLVGAYRRLAEKVTEHSAATHIPNL